MNVGLTFRACRSARLNQKAVVNARGSELNASVIDQGGSTGCERYLVVHLETLYPTVPTLWTL